MFSPAQCRMARAALELGVRDLAKLADVSAMTVTRFENGHSQGYPETLEKLRRALEAAGIIFVAENGEGPGVRLKKHLPSGDLSRKIETIEQHLAATKIEGKPSPERALQQMRRAHTKNELVKLKNKRAKGNKGSPK